MVAASRGDADSGTFRFTSPFVINLGIPVRHQSLLVITAGHLQAMRSLRVVLPFLCSVLGIKVNPLKPPFQARPIHTDYHTVSVPITPEDGALIAAAGTRRYQNRLEAGLGVTLFGGSSFVWLAPMLFDDSIARATGLPKATLVATSLCIYGGWIAGCCVLSPAGDRFGRKRILILSALLAALGAFGTALTPLIPVPFPCVLLLAASRAVGGFSLGGMMSQALALALESSESSRLKSCGIRMNMYYCAAIVILAAFHGLCGVVVTSGERPNLWEGCSSRLPRRRAQVWQTA